VVIADKLKNYYEVLKNKTSSEQKYSTAVQGAITGLTDISFL